MIATFHHRGLTCMAIAVAVFAMTGCRGTKMPSIPILDSMGLLPDEAIPADVAARFGPTATDRIREIDRLADKASRAPAAEQQTISQTLAEQIRTEKDPLVRQRIVRAIARCRTPLAAAVLRAGLEDVDLDVRMACAKGWGGWGGDEAVTHLGRLVGDTSEELDMRLAAATALGHVKDPGSAQALAPAIEPGENPALQHRAMQSLNKVAGQDHGNDLVAWRRAIGTSSPERIVDRVAPPSSSESESSPSLAERTFFWWR